MSRKDDDEKEVKKPATKSTPAPTATDYMTEQEKGATDPVNPPVEPEKAEVLDIPKNQPYPTGDAA